MLLEVVGPRMVIGTLSLQYPRRAFFAQEHKRKSSALAQIMYVLTFYHSQLPVIRVFIENECSRISEESISGSSIQSLSLETCSCWGPFIVGFGRREDQFQTPGAICNKALPALTQGR